MAIVEKEINGYGPYLYRVTSNGGDTEWEYLGRADGKEAYDVRTQTEDSDELNLPDDFDEERDTAAGEFETRPRPEKEEIRQAARNPAEIEQIDNVGGTIGDHLKLIKDEDGNEYYATPKTGYDESNIDWEDAVQRAEQFSEEIELYGGQAARVVVEEIDGEKHLVKEGISTDDWEATEMMSEHAEVEDTLNPKLKQNFIRTMAAAKKAGLGDMVGENIMVDRTRNEVYAFDYDREKSRNDDYGEYADAFRNVHREEIEDRYREI